MKMWIYFGIIIILGSVCADKSAVVYLSDPSGNSGVFGNVTFTKTADGIVVTGTVTGLGAGNHGFHIHSLGYIAPGCTETGGHFNPHNATHGAPGDAVRHIGDLGNINANASGIAYFNFTDTIIDLDGEHNIIGRAVVVHANEDDLGKGNNSDSLITGNAGGRVACGVIGIKVESSSSDQIVYSSLLITGAVIFLSQIKTLIW